MLVVGRVLQGIAGGPLIPLSQTLLLRIFPKEKAARRHRAVGDDHAGRAGARPDPRRLAVRQLSLAADLPHQRAARTGDGAVRADACCKRYETHAVQGADRSRSASPCW